eukprot:snap_masked-scaffold_4-processed-gene-21.34-mRNA-1 protein AED:1.00 eAED:1.00 QI:0/-1/0/0/-1/1/1/0/67
MGEDESSIWERFPLYKYHNVIIWEAVKNDLTLFWNWYLEDDMLYLLLDNLDAHFCSAFPTPKETFVS